MWSALISKKSSELFEFWNSLFAFAMSTQTYSILVKEDINLPLLKIPFVLLNNIWLIWVLER